MELYLILSIVFATVFATSSDDIILKEFELYKAEFNKTYTSPAENTQRLEVFKKTKLLIAEHNLKYTKGEVTYSMALNMFADWLPEEFGKTKYHSKRNLTNYFENKKTISGCNNVPDSFNWVEKGAVTSVKDQNYCEGFYAFSALGALEAFHYFKTKKLISLSAQQIIDCSTSNSGCQGGDHMFVYDYIRKAGGINSDEVYPFEAREGECRFNPKKIEATCDGYKTIYGDENDLKTAVATIGPISVSIYAPKTLNLYGYGVFEDDECKEPLEVNHELLLVGYGTDEETGEDYWLLKNSWSSHWGEKGYLRLARNKDNMCGITDDPIYPIV